jgi:hypothetical protein
MPFFIVNSKSLVSEAVLFVLFDEVLLSSAHASGLPPQFMLIKYSVGI